ncbi:hypothetical protein MMC26_003866 [Xylographa opegraphella]|nr:hypothetical protein [Xylographa opegraphella]
MSPTASLLRQSRLFSLPPPLPRPNQTNATTGITFQSDTATLPYPIHASIETTQSSLARGDWGLKRPLPQRSTSGTTTPVIRIGAIDTIDHITDFNSAADHTLTLRKWQEMNMPVSMPQVRRSISNSDPLISTFEEDLNSTEATGINSSGDSKRWKYRGPWLAGKTAGEFEDYITKRIKKRRPEFRKYMREWLRQRMTITARRDAIDKGKDIPSADVKVSEEELQAEIIKLRHDPTDLWVLIWRFLDLPGSPPGVHLHAVDRMLTSIGSIEEDQANKDIEQGPPTTHPSAGLSYLRTASHVPNHPILGPLSSQPPVITRILKVPSPAGNIDKGGFVGVGGIVAQEAKSRVFKDAGSSQWTDFDADLEGGAKGWVHLQRASIDPQGRIKLEVERASDDSIALWEGLVAPDILAAQAAGKADNGTKLTRPARAAERLFNAPKGPLPTKVYDDPTKIDEITRRELNDMLVQAGFQDTVIPEKS